MSQCERNDSYSREAGYWLQDAIWGCSFRHRDAWTLQLHSLLLFSRSAVSDSATAWIVACQTSLSLVHSLETALLSRRRETGATTSILPFGVFHWLYFPFRKSKIKGWKWAYLHPGLMLSWSKPPTHMFFFFGLYQALYYRWVLTPSTHTHARSCPHVPASHQLC